MTEFGSSLELTISGIIPEETIESVDVVDNPGLVSGTGSEYFLNATSLADGQYELKLVTSDPAGNLTEDVLPFIVDTQPPLPPTVKFEQDNGGINYWETLDGLRMSIIANEAGDVIDPGSVTVNGTMVSSLPQNGFFMVSQDLLLGDSPNVLGYTVLDRFGTPAEFTNTFDVDLTKTSVNLFEVSTSAFSENEANFVEFKVYIPETTLTEYLSSSRPGTSIDLLLDLADTFQIDASRVRVSGELDDASLNFSVSPGNVFMTSYSIDTLSDVTDPIISVIARTDNNLNSFSYDPADKDLEISMVWINEFEVTTPYSYDLGTSDLLF
jgi:hypothetical protein